MRRQSGRGARCAARWWDRRGRVGAAPPSGHRRVGLTARRIVLDPSALLAWIRNERGAETVGRKMQVAAIPAPNLTEALFRARWRGHRLRAEELHDHVLAMGLEVESFRQGDTV